MSRGGPGAFRARRDGGMSLVEVMVSATILVLVLVGFLGLTSYVTELEQDSRESQLAVSAAKTKIEEIKAYAKDNYALVESQYNNQNFRVGGLLPWTSDADGMPGKVTVTLDNPDLKSVTILIQWRHKRRNNSYTLSTKITNRG